MQLEENAVLVLIAVSLCSAPKLLLENRSVDAPSSAVDGAIALQKAIPVHTQRVLGCKRQIFGTSLAVLSECEQPENSDISVFCAAYRAGGEIGGGGWH